METRSDLLSFAADGDGRAARDARLRRHFRSASAANPTRFTRSISIPARSFGNVVGRIEMPNAGDELHHFGWNACSAALCPYSPHPHVERRYLIVPGLRSSRIHVIDTKPDARNPQHRARHRARGDRVARPATAGRIRSIAAPTRSTSARWALANGDGPGGIFLLDHESFDVLGRWEVDRGPQYLAYDFWWHLG